MLPKLFHKNIFAGVAPISIFGVDFSRSGAEEKNTASRWVVSIRGEVSPVELSQTPQCYNSVSVSGALLKESPGSVSVRYPIC